MPRIVEVPTTHGPDGETGHQEDTGPDNRTTSQPRALEMSIKMTCFEITKDNIEMLMFVLILSSIMFRLPSMLLFGPHS